MNTHKKIKPLITNLQKLITPKLRKTLPKPGELLKLTDIIFPGIEFLDNKKWTPIPKNGITTYWTVAYINQIEQTTYRYPTNKKNFNNVISLYKKYFNLN